jgi:transcriptional regulator with XRE-family HTH domain
MQGLSQKEAAKSMGVDQSTLARWERGEREPTGTFLTRVVQFLNEAQTASSATARIA